MKTLDLKKNSGVAVSFDGSSIIPQEGSISAGSQQEIMIDDMRSQLLNPDLSCPFLFYRLHGPIDRKSIFKRRNLRLDLIVIPQNLAGIEYVKTSGMRLGSYPTLLEVVYGYVTILMQSSDFDPETGIRTMIVKLKRGEKYVIPPNVDFVLVNTRHSISIVSMVRSSKSRLYNVFDDTRGAASYIIRKNARQEIVQNPYFRNVLHCRAPRPEKTYRHFNLTKKTPVFKQIMRKYDQFRWLHEPDQIEWESVPKC
jgi:oxalate decarboxylase/phosphoglucose isomerase-like protein (cupin superfamily)